MSNYEDQMEALKAASAPSCEAIGQPDRIEQEHAELVEALVGLEKALKDGGDISAARTKSRELIAKVEKSNAE